MRKIFADAQSFVLVNGDNVTITLLNKIGQKLTTTYENKLISFDEKIQVADNKFDFALISLLDIMLYPQFESEHPD